MKKRTFNAVILLILSLLIGAIGIVGQETSPSQKNRKDAERIWEKAIEAKGGRHKLHSIKNMVLISRAKVRYSLFKTYGSFRESLMVFPDKRWTWNDYRPSVFGLQMSMYNHGSGMKYHQVLDSPDNIGKLVPFETTEQNQLGSKMPRLVLDLMETYWLKPVPQGMTAGKIRGKSVDIVQTSLEGDRIDFALDQKTHLPIQIIYHSYDHIANKTFVNKYDFSNYVAVDGIMMATATRPEGESGKEVTTFQFNVEYDENIFKTPPPFEAGPEAWRKK